MGTDTYSVHPLVELTLPWRVRRKLRKVKRRGWTGVLMHGVIRTPLNSMSPQAPVVAVREATSGRRLGFSSPRSKSPKWADLLPGPHRLRFNAIRARSASSFEWDVDLGAGDVLLAVCEPIQPWTIFGASPSTDRWYLGMV